MLWSFSTDRGVPGGAVRGKVDGDDFLAVHALVLVCALDRQRDAGGLILVHRREDEDEEQEFVYILSGTMKFYIGDISYELTKGDSIYFDSGKPHSFKAIGDKPLKFLAIVIK